MPSTELRNRLESALAPTYRIDRELGGGGMSRVYVAYDGALGREVVVKLLSPELAATVSVDRFRREIMLAAALQHPHIVGVLGAGEVDGLPYFTMPFVDGESLRVRLEKGPLNPAQAVSILRDVARALAFAHDRGVVHRDIKPDNVLLAGGSAMVADFGVAKAVSAALRQQVRSGGGTLTGIGTSLGTPQYMAPEQAAGDPDTDHRADIYAFGVMAYEMLTGKPPFHGRSPQALLAAQLTEAPERLVRVRPGLPEKLVTLVHQCLEKDPAARPQTAAEVVAWLDDPAVVSGAFASDTTSSAVLPSVRRGSRRGLLIAAALLIVSLGSAGYWLSRGRATAVAAPVAAAPAVAVRPAAARSVAILPLVSLDSADARLAEAMTDEITNAVAKEKGIWVASRTASAAALRSAVGPAEIAKALNVRTVVEGTVQRESDRVRVTARLVDANDGFMLWADVYEGSTKHLFAMQDSIAKAIGTALAERVGG